MSEKIQQALSSLEVSLKEILKNQSNNLNLGKSLLSFSTENGHDNYGKGLSWSGHGSEKQFLLAEPDKFYSTENIDLAKNKSLFINSNPVISEDALGPTVVKSNIKQLGRLKSLSVDGDMSVNEFLFYNSNTNRLGLGTDQPNAAISIVDEGVEIIIGAEDSCKAKIGTFGNHEIAIVTDDKERISIDLSGNIKLGDIKNGPIRTSIYGKLYVGTKDPDPRVDLHVEGPIKFNGYRHEYSHAVPTLGDYRKGDIIWNEDPKMGGCVGWVCVRSGTPGGWLPFGEIKANK
jgi:hypothetical protein